MAIKFQVGNMFSASVEAIINTVNCVGVMGKGVALEFKRRWPDNFKEYKKLCDAKLLRPGQLFIFQNEEIFSESNPKFLINFPTKLHWREKSRLEYVEDGLDALIAAIDEYKIRSIALPPLGCGNGGLDWNDVKPLIQEKLGHLESIDIQVFEPRIVGDEPEHNTPRAGMTFERAILLKSLGDLEVHFDGQFDRISMQKIAYFLQALGTNFRLDFSRNLFGPYSEALKRAYISLERHEYISGFTSKDRTTHVTPSGYAMADEFLNSNMSKRAKEIIGKLDKLIQGYESPYGLELLSSVHLLACGESIRPVERVIEAFSEWNDRKRNKFTPNVIRAAYDRLEEDALIS